MEAKVDVNSAKLQIRHPPGRVIGLLAWETVVVLGLTWIAVLIL
jgi:hypothetical protein